MRNFFFTILSLCVFIAPAYAEDNVAVDDYTVRILDEKDYESFATISKLRETIPVAEENCIRVRRNKDACLCENMHLYSEYNTAVNDLKTRHPDWAQKTMVYDFYMDGATYQGEDNFSDMSAFSEKINYIDCSRVEY